MIPRMHKTLSRICDQYLTISINHVKNIYNLHGRYFHNWSHIVYILNKYYEKHKCEYSANMMLAILFHDIVYNPKSLTNEEDSCIFFDNVLQSKFKNTALATSVMKLILGTKDHKAKNELNTYDLAILNEPMSMLLEYEKNIRKEFSHIEPKQYKKHRIDFLKQYARGNVNLELLIEYIKDMY